MSACADGRPALAFVDQPLDLVRLLVAQRFSLCEGGDKGRKGAAESVRHKLFALSLVKLFFGDQDDDSTAVILKDAALAEPFEHCVGCRALPAKLRFTDFYQAACADGGGLPYDIRKAPLHQS